MERRSFIRSLLAGLALAPVAKYLIDLPTARPPAVVGIDWAGFEHDRTVYRVFSNTDLTEEFRRMPAYTGSNANAELGTHVDDLFRYGMAPRPLPKLKGDTLRFARRFPAPEISRLPLTEGRGSFAAWDKRVGRALLS